METLVAPAQSVSRLTPLQQSNLKAAALRVLPSDEGCGAREAGAEDYVVRMVETRSGPGTVRDLKTGLEMLEDLACHVGAKSFANLSEDEQDQVLRQLQLTPHPTLQRFFRQLVALTVEGFLCNPQRGGNHRSVGWVWLGIRGTQVPEACCEEEPCTTS